MAKDPALEDMGKDELLEELSRLESRLAIAESVLLEIANITEDSDLTSRSRHLRTRRALKKLKDPGNKTADADPPPPGLTEYVRDFITEASPEETL